jgi:predicted nucleic-acid-binding protein
MIGLDTNILLRYLVRDDREQATAATRIIEVECTPEHPGFIDQIALCEFVWTLGSVYRYRRAQISMLLSHLLRTDRIRVEEQQEVASAVADYISGHDFADALICRRNMRLGCSKTVTFDRRATRLPSMELALS